jgi:hypothetical protein
MKGTWRFAILWVWIVAGATWAKAQGPRSHSETAAVNSGWSLGRHFFTTIWAPMCENLKQNKVGHPGRRQHLQASSQ